LENVIYIRAWRWNWLDLDGVSDQYFGSGWGRQESEI